MNLLALYCTHQTTPLAIRERLAFSSRDRVEHAYKELRRRIPECEAVILSTCNRVEIYVTTPDEDPQQLRQQLSQFLSEFHKVPLDEFVGELQAAADSEAVWH